MGSMVNALAPAAGAAAGGYVQGRQLRTAEDQTRQNMAVQAAAEGRQKEEHRLNIQQLGLAIQGMQQAQDQAAKMFPGQMESQQQGLYGGRPTAPGAEKGLEQAVPGFDADPNTPYSANLDIAQLMGQGLRAKDVNNLGHARVNASQTPVEKPLEALKVLEAKERQLRADAVRLNTDLTGGRIKREDSARAQAALRRIQYDLLPKAEKAVQEFRKLHPELGGPSADGGNDLLSDD